MSLLRAAVTVLATAALGLPGAGAAHAAESGTDPSTRAPIPVGYHPVPHGRNRHGLWPCQRSDKLSRIACGLNDPVKQQPTNRNTW